jgi:hypothetical protein
MRFRCVRDPPCRVMVADGIKLALFLCESTAKYAESSESTGGSEPDVRAAANYEKTTYNLDGITQKNFTVAHEAHSECR